MYNSLVMKMVNLTEGWTWKMKIKWIVTGIVGFFHAKLSWHVAHKIFTKEELNIMNIDLSFLDNYKKK